MQLIFAKEDLFRCIQGLQTVAGGRNTLPILSNVMISAHDSEIKIAATDLEVSIQTIVTGTIIEEGDITVSARKLAEIVRELPDQEIRLTATENGRLEIMCGDGVYKIIGLPSDEFPELSSVTDDFLTINGAVLCSMIEKTEFSASTEETRYFLNGIYFDLTSEYTRLVATDGRRLAFASCDPLITPDQDIANVIVPLKAVREVVKSFAHSAEIKICLQENKIIFADNTSILTSRLVEGEYPKYDQIVPTDNELHLTLNVQKTLGALKRVALLSNPKTYSIRLDVQEDKARLSAKTPELGEAYELIDIENTDLKIEIAFDARFVIEAVEHIQSEDFRLELKDTLSAAVLKPTDEDNHLCLIMPMRLEA